MRILPKNTAHFSLKKQSGFTLVELLVVIVILGVVSALAISNLRPAFFYGKGRDARRQSDLEIIRSALEQQYADNGRVYPNTSYSGLSTPLSAYLDSFPTDPKGGSFVYTYTYSSDRKCYQLAATMESTTPPTYEVCGGSLACQSANSFCQ